MAKAAGSLAVFCGAGVSVPMGCPTTDQIFRDILNGLKDKRLFADYSTGDTERKRLQKLLYELFPTLNEVVPSDHISICSILSLIDHLASTKTIPIAKWQFQKMQELQYLLEQAIAWVIDPGDKRSAAQKKYLQLLKRFVKQQSARRNLTWITTNYDIWLEEDLFEGLEPEEVASDFDFGFSWRCVNPELEIFDRPASRKAKYRWYKLHGSFNWVRCELCAQIYINTWDNIVDLCLWEKYSDSTCHCEHFPLRPMLVSPSLVRDLRDSNLLEIWRHSLEALQQADEWVFVGYSFPEEDYAIRAMLLRAYHGRIGKNKKPPLVKVIARPLPDEDAALDEIERAKRNQASMQARALAVLPGAKFYPIGAEQYFAQSLR